MMVSPFALIDGYLEGRLTDKQFADLVDWLHADPQNAESFAIWTQTHQQIEEQYRKQDVMSALADEALDPLQATAHGADSADMMSEASTFNAASDWERLLAGPSKLAEKGGSLSASRQTSPHYLALAGYVLGQALTSKPAYKAYAIAAILMVAATLIFVFAGDHDTNDDSLANQSPGVGGHLDPPTPAHLTFVATLTSEYNAVWEDRPGQDLYAGQRIELTSGFAEITTDRGAVAILEAPVTVELMGDRNAIRLHAGKLTGICETDTSKGFAVHTPTAKLVDVGTVFGVEVTPGKATQLHVIRGQVNAAPVTADGRVGVYTRVTANQAVTIQAEQPVQSVDFDRKRFAMSLPAATPRPIAAHDEILLDLGWMGQETETHEGNYNNLGGEADGLIFTAGDQPRTLLQNMLRTSDGASTTVGFSIQEFLGEPDTIIGFGSADLGPSTPPLSDFPASVTRDTIYMQSKVGDQPSKATLRFSGLDDSLVYELTLVSYLKNTERRPENFFAASGQRGSYNPAGGGTATLKGLTTDGRGNLDIVWTCSKPLGINELIGGQLDGIRLTAKQP